MDKKSKIFFLVFFLLIIGAVGATYYRIMIKKDYIISAETDCDPYTENCFVWECDPSSTVEGEACTGDPETDIWYYKIIKRNAGRIPLCDPNDENCTALVCDENESECAETLCDETTKAEQGVECVDPVQYTAENPVEEEAVECEEGDEECLSAQDAAAQEAEASEETTGGEASGEEESADETALETAPAE